MAVLMLLLEAEQVNTAPWSDLDTEPYLRLDLVREDNVIMASVTPGGRRQLVRDYEAASAPLTSSSLNRKSLGKQIRSGHTIRPLPDMPVLRHEVLAVSGGQALVVEEPGDAGPGSSCNGAKCHIHCRMSQSVSWLKPGSLLSGPGPLNQSLCSQDRDCFSRRCGRTGDSK